MGEVGTKEENVLTQEEQELLDQLYYIRKRREVVELLQIGTPKEEKKAPAADGDPSLRGEGETGDADFAFARKLFPEEYDREQYSDEQWGELELGASHDLDVSKYDDNHLLFRQMREIRLGMEQGLDVRLYANRYFRDRCMREIRLGLMEGLRVVDYAKLIYSLPDMHASRSRQIRDRYEDSPESIDFSHTDRTTGITIFTKEGRMKAYIRLSKRLPSSFSTADLDSLLFLYGVSCGVNLDRLGRDLTRLDPGKEYLVAEGIYGDPGKDGFFEYAMPNIESVKPKMREDGSIDYRAQQVYAMVRTGECLVIYHPAEGGTSSRNVSGILMNPEMGTDMAPLQLKDVEILADGVTHVAMRDGMATQRKGVLQILDRLEVNGDVSYLNGNIQFEGDICIKGNVRENVMVEAGGNIIVEGTVESASLKAAGDIIISRGLNGNDVGYVEAGGSVYAAFFENAVVIAGEDVEAGYFLNSNVRCQGYVKTKGSKSLITGGSIIAAKGIEAGVIGTTSHARTELEVGEKNNRNEKSMQIYTQKKELQIQIEKTEFSRRDILEQMGTSLAATNKHFMRLSEKLDRYHEELKALEDEEKRLEEEEKNDESIMITVQRVAYANTRVTVNGKSMVLYADLRNPCFRNKKGVISDKQ